MKHLLAFCLLLVAMSSASAEPSGVRLAYADIESFPNQLGGSTDIPASPGIAVEILQESFAEAGIPLNLMRLPNRRVIEALKMGEIDGAFLFSYSPERNRFAAYPLKDGMLDPSRRLTRLTYMLYKRADNPLTFDGREVGNLRTAIIANSGFSVAADLRKMDLPVVEVETTPLAFGMLQAGRADGYAIIDSTADAYLRGSTIRDIVKLPIPISSKDYFLIFGRRFQTANPALVESIWNRVAATRAARQAELDRKYLGSPPS